MGPMTRSAALDVAGAGPAFAVLAGVAWVIGAEEVAAAYAVAVAGTVGAGAWALRAKAQAAEATVRVQGVETLALAEWALVLLHLSPLLDLALGAPEGAPVRSVAGLAGVLIGRCLWHERATVPSPAMRALGYRSFAAWTDRGARPVVLYSRSARVETKISARALTHRAWVRTGERGTPQRARTLARTGVR